MTEPADRSGPLARLASRLGPRSDLAHVLRGASAVMVVQALGSAVAFGTTVLLARWLGAFDFGVFVFAWTWATVLPVLGSAGLNKAALRFVPEYLAREDWAHAAGVIRHTRGLTFAAGLAVAGAAAAITWGLGERVPAHYQVPMYLAFGAVPFMTLLLLYAELCRGFGWATAAYAPQLIVRPVLFVVGVGLVWALRPPLQSVEVTAVALGSAVLTTAFVAMRFARRLPETVRSARPARAMGKWLRVALPLLATEGVLLVLWPIDVFMLGAVRGPDEVAVYNACARTAGLALFVLTAVSSLATPRFVNLREADPPDPAALQRFVGDVARWTFLPSLGIVAAVFLVGRPLLGLFGEEFVAGAPVLLVLVVGFAISAMTGPAKEYLVVGGQHDRVLPANAWAGLVNVVLNLTLIPPLGMLGAAIATTVSLTVLTARYFVLVRRHLGLDASFLAR